MATTMTTTLTRPPVRAPEPHWADIFCPRCLNGNFSYGSGKPPVINVVREDTERGVRYFCNICAADLTVAEATGRAR